MRPIKRLRDKMIARIQDGTGGEGFDDGSFRRALLTDAANLVRDGFLIPAGE